MRPARFQDFAVDLAKASGAASAATLAEAGDTKHPFGLAAKTSGGEMRFQFTAQAAPGEKYDEPERPVEGDPVEPGVAAGLGGTAEERWFAELVASSGSREVRRLETWTPTGTRGAGVTVHFRNEARIYARVL